MKHSHGGISQTLTTATLFWMPLVQLTDVPKTDKNDAQNSLWWIIKEWEGYHGQQYEFWLLSVTKETIHRGFC